MGTNALDITLVKHIMKDTSGDGNLLELVGSANFLRDTFFGKASGQDVRKEECPCITYLTQDIDSKRDKRQADLTFWVHSPDPLLVDAISERLNNIVAGPYNDLRSPLPKIKADKAIIGKVKEMTEEDALSASGDIFLKKTDYRVMYVIRRQ